MVSEDDLIKRISRVFAARKGQVRGQAKGRVSGAGTGSRRQGPLPRINGLRVGIGDDAAIISAETGKSWVVTTDSFLESVHFLRKVHPPDVVGYKALARATSDIAAMGGCPRYFFLTLGIPDACTGSWLDAFLRGMARAARQFGLTLAGGDTTKYPSVVVSLTVIGEISTGRAVLRSRAKPGDLLCVSGMLGEAELGLRLAMRRPAGESGRDKRSLPPALKKHFYPEPRLALGQWLAQSRMASAMIDTSDGLSTDLAHLCKASGVGARVWREKLPVRKVAPELQRLNMNMLSAALHGGEDYELLFTVPKKLSARLPRKVAGVPITVIGDITRQKKILLVDERGKAKPLRPGGWDPFRKC